MANEETSSINKQQLMGKLLTYRDNFNSGLSHGQEFAKLFGTLTTTTDLKELFDSAKALFDFKIDSEFVRFPHQFEPSDNYLIFMTRLLELHHVATNLNLNISDQAPVEELFHSWKGTEQTFRFVANNGIANYTEQASNRTLFSMNLGSKTMEFNTDAINQLYFTDDETIDHQVVDNQIQLFSEFGRLLQKVYDFKVDFNMFDVKNSKIYYLDSLGLPTQVLDELFVSSHQNKKVFLNVEDMNGGYLELPSETVFSIVETDEKNHQWAMKVADPKESVSLFNILNDNDFMRTWYMNNVKSLKLKSVM
ncbi:hypothetical protein [Pediococcus argentinicus]|uniref:Uncharacterized protein n=1 Tax=Pediococcus argentinicus TaxID=480391 RepID=A0A0R2NHY5_9LACO|nr:hypothetical protein [Pediococcus argentinicus]KRO25398.1 hypothetical protein IV88_GL000235 [Pediococcus argentinicus]NKZ22316.1 hypothetical protein [Pediococcus argentinicus]GEP19319.1 hypothetical protein LSA03_07030 [Pediococcus argentinicus]